MAPNNQTIALPNGAMMTSMQQFLNAAPGTDARSLRPHLGLHQNGLLRKDEWSEIDSAVVETVKTGLVGVQDLMSQGLTKKLGGLGTLLSGYEQIGEMTAANVAMDADVPGQEDNLEFGDVYVPIPIIFKDFRVSLRKLEASRKLGETIDTSSAKAATRVVREAMENMIFAGHAKQLAGYQIEGYTDATYRITDTAVGDFATAGNAYKTVVKALNALNALGFNGPFMVYLASTQYGETLNLIDPTSGRSERDVIKANIPDLIDIKRSFDLTAGHMVMVQMTSDVVDLAIGADVQAIQWQEMGGMIFKYRVMSAMAPRVKYDANLRTGVLHYTGC